MADQISLFADIYKCYYKKTYSTSQIAYGFHRVVTELALKMCLMIRQDTKENKVCLSGGVFNNRIILTDTIKTLTNAGFEVYWNKIVPLGDGGISTGQAYFGLLEGRNNS